ncbi:DUF4129 domain-containing protein [Streptomyces sp. MP131-18]|uniref:DUF4129 domain-containing protein n=1 Tax=Streptomyces sp. MP131-18 TaxID=1857892 RepID=UPI00097C0EEF|nr:DUF4129 domain-containing protein [Streptomyces sp. MP131-18]ONK13911.1 hypothetical protein STBA_46870 [Streptomyces sp. MP131-18]
MALPRADDPGPPVVVDRAPAAEDAERELSRQIYTEHEPGLARRVWDWLWERIFGVLESAAFATPGGWVGLLVIAAVVVALAILLRLRLGALSNAAGRRPGAVFTDRPRTAAEHRAAAEEHARAAHWTPAVQERMRAVVRSLEERALLDPRPGRTAHEAADEAARPLPGLTAALHTAAAAFDAVTYGAQPAAPADYEHLRTLDQDLARTKPDLTATPSWARP